MPADRQERPSLFDRFASTVSKWVSKAWFFVGCVLLVLIWAPSIMFLDVDTWQLVINTATTIITFLLVALLQNTQTRSDAAIQTKLNAIAGALADLMQVVAAEAQIDGDRRKLLSAVGLEDRESTAGR